MPPISRAKRETREDPHTSNAWKPTLIIAIIKKNQTTDRTGLRIRVQSILPRAVHSKPAISIKKIATTLPYWKT